MHQYQTCLATIELSNGETVTPCHKAKGHNGDHEGYCLGSKAVWSQGQTTDGPEESNSNQSITN